MSAYGQRSEDGRRFTKNQTLRDEFESTEAYSVLFMELMTDTGAAVDFINSVIPAGMAEEAARVAAGETPKPVLEVAPTPEPQKVTRAQMTEMSQEEFRELGAKLASGEAVLVD